MAVYTAGTTSTSTTNAASYAGSAFTPAANDLIVVVLRSGETAATTGLTTTTGPALTFTRIAQTLLNGSVDFVEVWVANALTTAVSHVFTWTCTGDNANGHHMTCARISGMTRTGLDAVRQFKEQENQAAGTPAPAFDAACLTGNLTLAVAGNLTTNSGLTVPSGWTARISSGYATPTSGVNIGSRASGFTGTTVTWGSASATVFGAVVVELDTSVPSSVITAPRTQARYSRR